MPATSTVKGPQTFKVPTEIRTGSFKRNYLVHVPTRYDGKTPLPMLVVIHGAFDTAKGIEEISGFSKLADKENFIVLYPNGIGILGYLQHWNAGHCCGKAQKDKIDDVGFVLTAIKDTAHRLKVDQNRIFMLGFSNGGMFTYRFAAEKSNVLAGAVAMAASIGSRIEGEAESWQMPTPSKPLPLLVMHGAEDTDIPFKGRASSRRGAQRYYHTVEESISFWASHNGCRDSVKTEILYGGAVELKKWTDCRTGKPIWFYAIKGWGHVWPGGKFTADLADKNPLKAFDAADIAWQFITSLE